MVRKLEQGSKTTTPTTLPTYFAIYIPVYSKHFHRCLFSQLFSASGYQNFQVNFLSLLDQKMILLLAATVAVLASLLIWGSFRLCRGQGQNSNNSMFNNSLRTSRRLPTRIPSPRSQSVVNELTERLQERADQMPQAGTSKSRRNSL